MNLDPRSHRLRNWARKVDMLDQARMQAGSKPCSQWCLPCKPVDEPGSGSRAHTIGDSAHRGRRSRLGDYLASTLGPFAAGEERVCQNQNVFEMHVPHLSLVSLSRML